MLCNFHILRLEDNIVGVSFLCTSLDNSTSRVLDTSKANRRQELAHFLWLATHHHRKNRCIYIFKRQIQFETSLLPRRNINTLLSQSITNSIYLFLTHRIFKVQIVAAIIIRYIHLIEITRLVRKIISAHFVKFRENTLQYLDTFSSMFCHKTTFLFQGTQRLNISTNSFLHR